MPRTYQEILVDLYALEANKGMDFRLSRLDPVLDDLGNPQRSFACVHVGGTNGKGSTCAMIESALRAGGHRTGLYTSPHLVSFRERIRIAGVPIDRQAVVRQVEAVYAAMLRTGTELTFFEIATIAAFLEMRDQKVTIAVVEVGLGGRLDATNVVHGEVAVLTSVGLDHTEYLGPTIGDVAREKSAIIKKGSVAVVGLLEPRALAVVSARAAEVGAPLLVYGRDFSGHDADASGVSAPRLSGGHQRRNAALAQAALGLLNDRFPVSEAEREKGIASARWPGRLEVVRPGDGSGTLVLDAAHNPEAVSSLIDALPLVAPSRPRVLVFAAMRDKDWPAMLEALRPHFDRFVFAPLPMPRAENPTRFLAKVPDGVVAASPVDALELAQEAACTHGSVVVAGSIYLLGHLYRKVGGTLLEENLED